MMLEAHLPKDVNGVPVNWITLRSEVQYGGSILQIPQTIESADAIVADLTNADANVMYELGFAHALKKPVLPIIQRDSTGIPSDLQGYLFYTYNKGMDPGLSITVRQLLERTFRDLLRPAVDKGF
jgi:hypothetical protein